MSKSVLAPGPITLSEVTGEVIRRAKKLDIVVREVCGTCNNGWLASLESKVRPILEPRLLGRGNGFITPIDQALMAQWATKTALLLIRAHMHRRERLGIPPGHLQCLLDGDLPPGTQVWMGRCEPLDGQAASIHLLNLSDQVDSEPTAYFVTFSIGWCFFHVYGIDFMIPERVRPFPSSTYRTAMDRLWPAAGSALWWPPRWTLEPANLQELGDWPLWDSVRRGEMAAPRQQLSQLQRRAARDAAARRG